MFCHCGGLVDFRKSIILDSKELQACMKCGQLYLYENGDEFLNKKGERAFLLIGGEIIFAKIKSKMNGRRR
jgi:hypothetical protein